MKLSCIRKKRNKIFQVKMIKKDVRKTIVTSFMFLFNSFERIKIKNTIFITEQMKTFSLGVICMTDEFSQ